MNKQLQNQGSCAVPVANTFPARGAPAPDDSAGLPAQIGPPASDFPDQVDELRRALMSALCMAV